MNQQLEHLLDQLACAGRAPEVEVQIVDEDEKHTAGRVVGRPVRRQDDAFLYRSGRWCQLVIDTAAVRQDQRDELLLDAVFVNLEFLGLEISHELVIPLVANDHIARDEIDAQTEGGLPTRCLGRLCGWRGGWRGCRSLSPDHGRSIPRRRNHCEHADDQELSEISHTPKYTPPRFI